MAGVDCCHGRIAWTDRIIPTWFAPGRWSEPRSCTNRRGPFELGSQTGRRGRGATPLYSYKALTGVFIAEHETELARLPGHSESAKLLEGFDGLDRYLATVGANLSSRRSRPATGRARALAAITALLTDVFDQQTDFEVDRKSTRL